MKQTIIPWLQLLALSPLILIGGLFFVAICAIFGTSERVPVTYLPVSGVSSVKAQASLNRLL